MKRKIINPNWKCFYKYMDKKYGSEIGDLFYLLFEELDKNNQFLNDDIKEILGNKIREYNKNHEVKRK